MTRPKLGSSFEDFLREEGIADEVKARALRMIEEAVAEGLASGAPVDGEAAFARIRAKLANAVKPKTDESH